MKRTPVLFVCLGNMIRSQMAEAFARLYGSDVLEPASAGLMPAASLSPLVCKVMAEKNVDLTGHFPKPLESLPLERYEIVVNMSGLPLPRSIGGRLLTWDVKDPVGGSEALHRSVRDEIETRVMRLILELRLAARQSGSSGAPEPPGWALRRKQG